MVIHEKLFNKPGLSLERLQSFCLVVEKGGFKKAAGKRPYRQAQFSRQVADLAKFFGSDLFIGRSNKLTPKGEKLSKVASAYFSDLERLMETSSDPIDLRIAAGESAFNHIVPRLLGGETKKLTRSVILLDRTSDASLEDILNYKADLAIVGKSIRDNRVHSVRLKESPTILIVSKEFNKNFYTENDIKRLSHNPTVLLSGEGSYRQAILDKFGRNQPNIIMQAPSFEVVKTCVASGIGVSYIPEYCFTQADSETLERHTPPLFQKVTRELFLIYRKNLPEISEVFGKIVASILRKFPAK